MIKIHLFLDAKNQSFDSSTFLALKIDGFFVCQTILNLKIDKGELRMKFVELFKMEVSMDKVSNHLANINTSNWSLRKNKFDSNLVYCTCMNVTLAQVEKRFSEIRFLIPGRCYSVQLFFKGPLPEEITNEQRFRRVPNEKFYRADHPRYIISALPIESTGFWILSLMCRKGSGLGNDALNLTNIFATQMVLNFNEEEMLEC
ncbi:hypothetical protein [Paenibacillus sp. FSL L8-0709]|uniref:hypothetical protein n=1 Tax=Paenibacillus sp. FSL L8-0709 TaxID=2975312 RepID=UPI0030F70999